MIITWKKLGLKSLGRIIILCDQICFSREQSVILQNIATNVTCNSRETSLVYLPFELPPPQSHKSSTYSHV